MNATVASPSEPAATVTVASLDELREVAEHDPRASEEDGGLRVAVTGVPVSQAEELHALVRDHVEAKLWSVVGEVDAMAALRSAADGAARLVELSRALDAVVRDTEDGVPVPATGPRIDHAADGAGPRRVHPTAAAVPPAQVNGNNCSLSSVTRGTVAGAGAPSSVSGRDGVQRAAQPHEAGGAVGRGPERRHGGVGLVADADAPELRLDVVADERVQLLRLADGDAGDRHAQPPVLRRAGIILGHLAELV
ncbi:hypothetical protein OsI_36375 [Oryza sativa Indica Group]|uniref:Uncharacterized protein n=1 Tax=Oryza sativa subsp. indica TaxID=39946 RepID=B8BKW8_ORYSI|nr:hypothetical protein OsI_36375 [Oryza sativa Indica Group]